MNCAVQSNEHQSFLVAGQESHCQLYNVNVEIEGDENAFENGHVETLSPLIGQRRNSEKNVRKRKPSADSGANRRNSSSKKDHSNSNQNDERRLSFEIQANDSIQTDFSQDSPFQRVVRISSNCKLMATGGTDSHVRIWSFPNMAKIFDIDAHTKEIDDLDFSPDSKQLVSIAKDGLALVWNVTTGKQLAKLNWTPANGVKYLFKRCRFGVYEGKTGQHRLFTIANPLGKVGKQVNRITIKNTKHELIFKIPYGI